MGIFFFFFFVLKQGKEICSRDIFMVFVFFFLRNLKEIFENLSFNFDIEKLPLSRFWKFFESSLPSFSRRAVVIEFVSSENVLTTVVSMVISDGDHSFIMETFFSYFSDGLQWEQEEFREQKFGYESKISLNLVASLARISFLR